MNPRNPGNRKQHRRRAVHKIIALVTAVMLVAATIASTEKVVAAANTSCNSSFDPYKVDAATISRCEMRVFPHTTVTGLPDGGRQYIYPTLHGEVLVRIPPASFRPLTATAEKLNLTNFRNVRRAASHFGTGSA